MCDIGPSSDGVALTKNNGSEHQPDDAKSIAAQAVQGSLQNVSASAFTLILGFVRTTLLARLLLPEDFGVLALALVFVTIGTRLRSLGLDPALIQRQDADDAFTGTYLSMRLGVELLGGSALLAIIPLVQQLYPDTPNLGNVMALLVIAFFLANVASIQETFLRKQLAFSRLAKTDVIVSIVMTVVAPYMAFQGWGVWALVGEQVSGMGTRFLLMWGPFRNWRPRIALNRDALRDLWQYSLSVWAITNLDYILDSFDDLWTGTGLGKISLGLYSRAYEYARYPRRAFANPLVTVFMPVFARLQQDQIKLSRAFYRTAHFIWRTTLLIAGVFALIMPEFIHLVIGDKWLPMLWTFRIMLIYTILDSMRVLLFSLFLATGKQTTLRNTLVVQVIFFVPAVITGAWLGGINGVAIATDAMLLVGIWRLYQPLKEMVTFSLWRLTGWPLIALAIAWTAGLSIEQAVSGDLWISLFLKVGVFVIGFGAILLLTEREDYLKGIRQVWGLLKNR